MPGVRGHAARMSMTRRRLVCTLAWMLLGGLIGAARPCPAADLDAPITATWSGIGLRAWASRLSESAGRPVLVDRRLDPDAVIRLDCQGEPLLEVLGRGAALADGELAVLESSIWIMPRGLSARLLRSEAARIAQIASLPARQRSRLTTTSPWSWSAGARPRDLVTGAAAEAGIDISGIDGVPHDHLPAMSLPELTLAERLDLVLAPFDLRVEWRAAPAASRGQPVPTGKIIAIAAGLPPVPAAASGGTQSPGRANPTGAKTSPTGAKTSPPGPKTNVAGQTYSLQVAAPLEELLAAIAKRLGLTLDLDQESLTKAGIASAEIVRLTVKDASRDALLHAILDPLALRWAIDGTRLHVFAPPPPQIVPPSP
jgi:hypothetical protein